MANRKSETETQKEYRGLFSGKLDERQRSLEQFIRRKLAAHILSTDELSINFSSITTDELARLISLDPSKMIRILFRTTGASPRSVARDLRIRIDSEPTSIRPGTAEELAAYFRELLPSQLPIKAILFHDRIQRETELIRNYKGRWEAYIRDLLNSEGWQFGKRRFRIDNKVIEIDAAYPMKGDPLVAIDVKRIEALQDYQKRTDEINAKARELKTAYKAVFMACVFFPFMERREMVLNRLDNSVVDHICFQDQTSDMTAYLRKILGGSSIH